MRVGSASTVFAPKSVSAEQSRMADDAEEEAAAAGDGVEHAAEEPVPAPANATTQLQLVCGANTVTSASWETTAWAQVGMYDTLDPDNFITRLDVDDVLAFWDRCGAQRCRSCQPH